MFLIFFALPLFTICFPSQILENGAWIGIALLILWELYLNSPFFERAAPMAPVVYDLLLN
jgi:hypothetical protein